MKKLLFFLSLVIFNHIHAQPYLSLLEADHQWSVDVYYAPYDPPGPPYMWTVTDQITVGGSVIVNSIEYTQILRNGDPSCLLREENGLVYKYDQNANIDRVLFDFTLEVNDTFNLIGSAYDDFLYCVPPGSVIYGNELIVETVETIELAGEMRKVITFEPTPGKSGSFQWIEGIGNLTGFDLLWELLDVTVGSALVCFTENSDTYFFNDATSCDNTTLHLPEYLQSDIILTPNPVSDRSVLQLPAERNIDWVRIYDVSGRLISETKITKEYLIVNAMDYASGLYVYQVLSKGAIVWTGKFIVK